MLIIKKLLKNQKQDKNLAFKFALRYLSLRARTKKELVSYLKKKGFELPAATFAVEKLENIHFLNDEEFGESFTRNRQIYKGKSKRFVEYELKKKGLSEDIIQKAINTSQSDLQTAKDFVERKKRINIKMDKQKFREKMIRLLSSRGFSFDIIKEVLKNE